MTDVVVVGAGGFGRELLDVIEAHNLAEPDDRINVLGVIDDSPSEIDQRRLQERGYAILGGVDWLLENRPCEHFFLGIGSPAVRRLLSERLEAQGFKTATVVHPDAVVGSRAAIGAGTVICAGTQVSTDVSLGRHVHLNPNSTIGHDAVLEDFVSINPGAIVSGEVRIEEATLVGAGAVVLQGLTLGRDATVGAAACVTKDVPDDSVAVGVPARW